MLRSPRPCAMDRCRSDAAMTDLDQFVLREIAFGTTFYLDERGVEHCIVPRDVLQRVTIEFDVEHVRRELQGPRFRQ